MRIACVCEQPREDSLSVLCQRSGFASVLGWCFHGAGASKTLALRRKPERASLTLAFPSRWRVRNAGVENGARMGYLDAGVGKEPEWVT
jgi:hypothetical protein